MLGCGDEDLLTFDSIIPLCGGLRRRRDVGEGTARLGFGQGYCSLPFSGVQFGDIQRDLLRRAERRDQMGGAGTGARVDAPRIVGGARLFSTFMRIRAPCQLDIMKYVVSLRLSCGDISPVFCASSSRTRQLSTILSPAFRSFSLKTGLKSPISCERLPIGQPYA